LNDFSLANMRREVASTDAIKSFVDVLPTEPVTPITGPVMRARLDEDGGGVDGGPRASFAQVRRRSRRHRVTDEVMTVALGDDRHEELSGDERSRIVGRSIDHDVIADEYAVDDRRNVRRTKLHRGSLTEHRGRVGERPVASCAQVRCGRAR
jgi:hypothetical protein